MSLAINEQRLGKLLIVEDDSVTGPWLKRKLTDYGFSTVLCASLAEALEAIKTSDFHAIVTDIFLSEDRSQKEGLKIVQAAHKNGIPAIIITSAADLEIAKKGLNFGASFLLEKPFEISDLESILVNLWEDPKGLTNLSERFFDFHSLTTKEKEITRMLLKGLSNKEIAEACGNTEKTIKFHLTIIFDKCGVKSRTELFNSIFPT